MDSRVRIIRYVASNSQSSKARLSNEVVARYMLLVIATIVTVSCASRSVILISSENDLQRGLTIEQVENILGKPYYQAGSTSYLGQLDVRYYISTKTNRNYTITYWDKRVGTIEWRDASATIEEAKRKLNAKIAYGQSKSDVRGIVGSPTHVTGTEFETYWWYYVSDEEIYVLLFKDNALMNLVQTSGPAIREYLQKYQQPQFR